MVLQKILIMNSPLKLPGYGISTPGQEHSKKAVGGALLEALESVFGISKGAPRKVILGGHDRGARICHRLVVDKDDFPNLDIIGTVLLDIVPTLVQWQAFADPVISTSYFHWPLLANAEIATNMIEAYGGGRWARDAHTRIAGSEVGKQRVASDGALEVYAELFEKRDTIYYSCLDYASGAAPEASQQAEDQKNGKKIEVPTLVMFSKAKLGARQDVANVWKDWVKTGVPYQGIGVGEGYGHYLPEEAYDIVTENIVPFIDKL